MFAHISCVFTRFLGSWSAPLHLVYLPARQRPAACKDQAASAGRMHNDDIKRIKKDAGQRKYIYIYI